MADSSSSVSAAAAVAIPHFGRVYLTGIWIASLLYGANCIVFGGAMYVMFTRRKPTWLLVGWSWILFSLATADIIIAFLQVYRPLTNDTILSSPTAWDLSWAVPDKLEIAHNEVYTTCVFAQDLLLIWRLYVVWGHNWKVAIVPFIVECVHITCAYVALALLDRGGSSYFDTGPQHWGLASWSLDIAVNTTVTLLIAGRLWYMGRKSTASIGRYTYRASMYTILESGGLFAGATVICFGMDVSGSIGGIAGIWALAQLACITPLIIIVRIGLGITHGRNRQVMTSLPASQPVAFQRPGGIHVHVSTDAATDDTYAMSNLGSKGNLSLDRTFHEDMSRADV